LPRPSYLRWLEVCPLTPVIGFERLVDPPLYNLLPR